MVALMGEDADALMYPLMATGASQRAIGNTRAATESLERAVSIAGRENVLPAEAARAYFELAQTVLPVDSARAHDLAAKALANYRRVGAGFAKQIAEVESFRRR